VTFRDRRLAGILRRCRDLPGQDLFQYVDDEGEIRDVRSDDINAYIREAAGSEEFSAKDFRTWAGTVLAFRALVVTGQGIDQAETVPKALARSVREAIEATAEQLGNTPAVARQSYVHPAVIEAYLEDGVRDAILAAADINPAMPMPPTPQEERAVLRLLATQAARLSTPRRGTSPARRRRTAR
jgi:DNA topoisomerase-1